MNDKKYGTLELVEKHNSEYWKITGSQPVIMISRIITGLHNDEEGAVHVPYNIINLEHIEWLMMRYDLDIKNELDWKRSTKELQEMRIKMSQINNLKPVEPKGNFIGKLMPFQQLGLDFLMKCSGNALLADEMGLGKSAQSIAYLCTDELTMPAL